jgi:hypothetical protein
VRVEICTVHNNKAKAIVPEPRFKKRRMRGATWVGTVLEPVCDYAQWLVLWSCEVMKKKELGRDI